LAATLGYVVYSNRHACGKDRHDTGDHAGSLCRGGTAGARLDHPFTRGTAAGQQSIDPPQRPVEHRHGTVCPRTCAPALQDDRRQERERALVKPRAQLPVGDFVGALALAAVLQMRDRFTHRQRACLVAGEQQLDCA